MPKNIQYRTATLCTDVGLLRWVVVIFLVYLVVYEPIEYSPVYSVLLFAAHKITTFIEK